MNPWGAQTRPRIESKNLRRFAGRSNKCTYMEGAGLSRRAGGERVGVLIRCDVEVRPEPISAHAGAAQEVWLGFLRRLSWSLLASCGEFVLVDQAAEEIAPADGDVGTGSRWSGRPTGVRRVQAERAVRPMPVVMRAVDAEQTVEVAPAQD